MKLLIVDDDRDLVDLLTFALKRAGFETIHAFDVPTAAKLLERETPDLVVLDVNLGTATGFDLLKDFRKRSDIPVIMLTARDTEEDTVRGLELGADDYISKPFSHRELVARIKANLRRRGTEWAPPEPSSAQLHVGPIVLNLAEHSAEKDGRALDLTVTEFRLLHYLMANEATAVPARAILKQVWGYDDPGGTDVVRVTVHRLRRKLEDNASNPRLLHTVPGVGFMLKPAAS